MSDDELKKLMDKVHLGVTSFNYNGTQVPCIILDEKKFDEIMAKVAGKSVSVQTTFEFIQPDTPGHIFVNIILTFSQGDIEEKFLLYANESLAFFESMESTTMLALSSPNAQVGKNNIYMIQLPKPEQITHSLDIIKRGIAAEK